MARGWAATQGGSPQIATSPHRDPDAWALYLRANHLSNEGACAAALELYEQAFLLDGAFFEVFLARVPCLLTLGRTPEARTSLGTYLEADFPGKDEGEAKRLLASLEGNPPPSRPPRTVPPSAAAPLSRSSSRSSRVVVSVGVGPLALAGVRETRAALGLSLGGAVRVVGPFMVEGRGLVGMGSYRARGYTVGWGRLGLGVWLGPPGRVTVRMAGAVLVGAVMGTDVLPSGTLLGGVGILAAEAGLPHFLLGGELQAGAWGGAGLLSGELRVGVRF